MDELDIQSEIEAKPTRRLDGRVFSDSGISFSHPDLTPHSVSRPTASGLSTGEIQEMLLDLREELKRYNQIESESSQKDIEKVNLKLNVLAQRFKEVFEVQSKKIKKLSTEIEQAQQAEIRMTSLIEKHNLVVNEFDLKLSRMQKIVDEQEIKLINTTTYLKEALHTLEKLKRL